MLTVAAAVCQDRILLSPKIPSAQRIESWGVEREQANSGSRSEQLHSV